MRLVDLFTIMNVKVSSGQQLEICLNYEFLTGSYSFRVGPITNW